MRRHRGKPVQYFTVDYLARCRSMRPGEVLDFLEGFRQLHGDSRPASRLISIKVPQDLLDLFRSRCRLEGVRYQSQIKRLMDDWVRGTLDSRRRRVR